MILVSTIVFCLVLSVVFVNISSGKKTIELSIVGEAFDSLPSDEKWNPVADLNGDGIIDVKDLALVGKDKVRTSKGIKTISNALQAGDGSTVISVEPSDMYIHKTDFDVDVDITDALDTWAWQFRLNWDPTVLNITSVTEGTFLSQGIYNTSLARGVSIVINHDEGWALIANTLLEEPVAYPTGNGTLATINFEVIEPVPVSGNRMLNLNETILLLGDGETEYSHSTEDGNFDVCVGDINGDRIVNIVDASIVSAHWYPGPPIGPLGFDSVADLNNDGIVNILDASIVSAHWYPGPPIGPLGHAC